MVPAGSRFVRGVRLFHAQGLRVATVFDWRWVQCGTRVIPGDRSFCICFGVKTVQHARCVLVVNLLYFEWVQRGPGLAFVYIVSCSSG